jgi:dihydroorotase
MSLYLHEDITPEVIREAKKAGITGVKSYPAGVTTVRKLPSSHQKRHRDGGRRDNQYK